MPLSPAQQEAKDEFIRVRGTWSDAWEAIVSLDADFLHAYKGFSAVPWRKNALEPKVKEFMYIAADASATHLYEPGIRQHIDAAFKHGATAGEINEVIELTSLLGIHSCTAGIPVVLEVLNEAGVRTQPVELDERRALLKRDYVSARGEWDGALDGLLELDPDFFEAYVELSSVPWLTGPLEPKVKELVCFARDAAPTHLFLPGVRAHVGNALRLGATVAEIMEVLNIVSVIGIHAATTAGPMLAAALSARNAPAE